MGKFVLAYLQSHLVPALSGVVDLIIFSKHNSN